MTRDDRSLRRKSSGTGQVAWP